MKLLFYVNRNLRDLGAACASIPGIEPVVADTVEELTQHLPDAEVLVLSNSTYSEEVAGLVRERAGRLSWIQFTSVGVDTFEKFGAPGGVIVCNAPGLRAAAVAEHAVALLLSLTRRIVAADRERQSADWQRLDEAARGPAVLEGAEVHCLGFGNIGRRVAAIVRAFGARVVAYNRHGGEAEAANELLPLASLPARIGAADAIVLCLPTTDETRGLFGRNLFGRLKHGVYLVNVGRGDLVDTAALLEALGDGTVAAAGLDVFDTEPLPGDSPLWHHPRVVMTPHIGGNGGDAIGELARMIARGCERIRQGLPPLNAVNRIAP